MQDAISCMHATSFKHVKFSFFFLSFLLKNLFFVSRRCMWHVIMKMNILGVHLFYACKNSQLISLYIFLYNILLIKGENVLFLQMMSFWPNFPNLVIRTCFKPGCKGFGENLNLFGDHLTISPNLVKITPWGHFCNFG